MKYVVSLLVLLIAACNSLSAQTVRDSVLIHFKQGYSKPDLTIRNNKQALNRIADSLRTSYADSTYILGEIKVVGSASPEGSIRLNEQLSRKRANALFDYLSQYGQLPDSLKTFTYIGRNWSGLLTLVEKDRNVPCRDEVITFLHDVVERCRTGEKVSDRNLSRLMELGNGIPYNYMYHRLFPELRVSQLILTYYKMLSAVGGPAMNIHSVAPALAPALTQRVSIDRPVPLASHDLDKPFYMALKTNMLYDALLVPNVGVEFYLGKNFSAAANWMYAWWNTNTHHRYWRVYGGDIGLRYWFGREAKAKPLTGHHIGLYGTAVTYDFKIGRRGYMGGEPGGTLFDKCHYGAGIEYGYSLPVARRLNIDFTLGLGYLGGKYYEYLHIDDCYVWQATKSRRYFGPTKAEVSLVWLLGRGNVNAEKGGRR